MQIICPECQFAREVDESKIPARSQVATCPKCKTKFKFREIPDEEPAPVETPVETPAEPEEAPQRIPDYIIDDASGLAVPNPRKKQEKAEENDRTFPPLSDPGQKHEDGLWEKLDDMAPPSVKENQEGEFGRQPMDQAGENTPSHQQPVPGWTGEFNEDFPDPMQMSDGNDAEEDSPLVPPPFEQLDRYGFFNGIFMTLKLILLSPRLFFSVMPVGGGLAKPLTFTILLTLVQTLIQYFWETVGLSSSLSSGADPVSSLGSTTEALLMLLLMPAAIALGQFLITGLYHILLIMMRSADKGFEGTFRALTYANAPIILGIFPMPMPEIELGWTVITAIWGLVLTIMGLKYIHKTSYSKAIPVALIPVLLGMIAAVLMYSGQMGTV